MRRWLPLVALLVGAAAVWLYLSPSAKSPTGTASGPRYLESSETVAVSLPTAPSSAPVLSNFSTTAAPPALAGQPPLPAQVSAPTNAPQAEDLGELDFRSAGPPKMAVESVLENMRTAVRDYGSMFGGNPVGTNPEITAALMGKNPKQVNFLKGEAGMRVNGNGELVDPWGTPVFFHQLSGSETEIRSAGPDRKMWTQDDLVIK